MELIGSTVVGLKNLTNNPADDYDPAWSPDGTRIAFTSKRDGNEEIYAMSADGSNVTRFTNSPDKKSGYAWSPDGSNFAFISSDDIWWDKSNIIIISLDGKVTNITPYSYVDLDFSWLPDGNMVINRVITETSMGWVYTIESHINLIDTDNFESTHLAECPDFCCVNFAWLSDNNSIAFNKVKCLPHSAPEYPEGYILLSDGSISRLTSTLGMGFVEWSPDRTRIIYNGLWDCSASNGCADTTYVVNSDGSGVLCISCINPNIVGWRGISWSPASDQIAFVSDSGGNNEIYILSIDGTSQINMTNNPASDWGPVWAPKP